MKAFRPTVIDVETVCARLKLKRSTVYKHIKEGKLPRPIKLGHASRWFEHEINAVLERAAAERG